MMSIVWLPLWFIGFIILIKDYKTESTRWAAVSFLLCGLGAFSVVFDENIIRYIIQNNLFSKPIVDRLSFAGVIFSATSHYMAPYSMLMFGLTSAKIIPKEKRKIIYFILLIPPILSYFLLPLTRNDSKTPSELMLYFRLLSIWAVPYILSACYFVIFSYFKEKSYIYKRHKLLNAIIAAPFMFYSAVSNFIFRDLGYNNEWRYFLVLIPIQFAFFLYFAIKYGILGVKLKFDRYKFAFDNLVNFISDSIIVLDEMLNIIEVNKVFIEKFEVSETKQYSFLELINNSKLSQYKDTLVKLINQSSNERKNFEIDIVIENKLNYYCVDAIPIMVNNEFYGTMLLFKDITVYKRNLELIKQNQEQLIEKERLISLSQLIGGIAHNIKTPLMGSAGGIHIIKRNTDRLYEYLSELTRDNESINLDYVSNLVNEMHDWENRIKEYIIYMSDVITVVKGQIKEFNPNIENVFYVKEVFSKVELLMSFEFKKSKCEFIKRNNTRVSEEIKGDINSLIQVINNLISNAIQASDDGNIIILGSYEEDNNIVFYVKNFGEKIPDEIQVKIFNKMVTTKGKNGTGLGLYISKAIIKGKFNGDIYFNSVDKETTFFIKIPISEL